jgi:2C-methyl-D-erythritol 2,4-cyclodiphosphate synthase
LFSQYTSDDDNPVLLSGLEIEFERDDDGTEDGGNIYVHAKISSLTRQTENQREDKIIDHILTIYKDIAHLSFIKHRLEVVIVGGTVTYVYIVEAMILDPSLPKLAGW